MDSCKQGLRKARQYAQNLRVPMKCQRVPEACSVRHSALCGRRQTREFAAVVCWCVAMALWSALCLHAQCFPPPPGVFEPQCLSLLVGGRAV